MICIFLLTSIYLNPDVYAAKNSGPVKVASLRAVYVTSSTTKGSGEILQKKEVEKKAFERFRPHPNTYCDETSQDPLRRQVAEALYRR